MTRTLICSLLLACVAAAAAGQSVWIVDKSSLPGFDFQDLQEAADFAADGDVLLLRKGAYGGLTLTGRALTLVGIEPNVQLSRLKLVGVPPGETFSVRDVRVWAPEGFGETAPFQAILCGGTVWLESVHVRGSSGDPVVGPGASLGGSDDVVFVRCEVEGGFGATTGAPDAGPGLRSVQSTSWAFETEFRGEIGDGAHVGAGRGGNAAEILDGSAFFATSSSFTGGKGGTTHEAFWAPCGCVTCDPSGDGGDGLVIDAASVTLQDPTLVAGLPGNVLDAVCGSGAPGQALVTSPSANLTTLPGTSRGLRVTAVAREGDPLQFAAFGDAGETVWWLLGLDAGSLYLPGKQAPLTLGLPLLATLPLVPVPAGGALIFDFPAPELPPGLEVVVLRSQAYFAAPGSGQLSNGTTTLLLDASL